MDLRDDGDPFDRTRDSITDAQLCTPNRTHYTGNIIETAALIKNDVITKKVSNVSIDFNFSKIILNSN